MSKQAVPPGSIRVQFNSNEDMWELTHQPAGSDGGGPVFVYYCDLASEAFESAAQLAREAEASI